MNQFKIIIKKILLVSCIISCSQVNTSRVTKKEIANLMQNMNTKLVNITINTENEIKQAVENFDSNTIIDIMNSLKSLEENGFLKQIRAQEDNQFIRSKKLRIKKYEEEKKILDKKLKKITETLSETHLINDYTTKNHESRSIFLKDFNKKCNFIHTVEESEHNVLKVENKKFIDLLDTKISNKFDKFFEYNNQYLNNLDNCEINQLNNISNFYDICNDFHEIVENLLPKSMEKAKNGANKIFRITKEQIDQAKNKMMNLMKSPNNQDNSSEEFIEEELAKFVGPGLIFIKKIEEIFITMKNKLNIKNAINTIINQFSEEYDISVLSKNLDSDLSGTGSNITSEYKQFKAEKNKQFYTKTQSRDINTILKELKEEGLNSTLNIDNIHKEYKIYLGSFDNALNNHEKKYEHLVSQIKKFTKKLVSNNQTWNKYINNNISKILGQVCAVWTLKDLKDYKRQRNNKKKSKQNDKQYARKPHPAQIVAIMRLLGADISYSKSFSLISLKRNNVDKNQKYIFSNLAQISTGNGKSVIIGITSTILALLGYEVSCACYSSYLSKRDHDSFASFFDLFDVKKYIKYGSFNDIAENIINEKINVREKIVTIIDTPKNTKPLPKYKKRIIKTNKEKRKKILFIDEVDIFFQENFYGNQYIPVASLKDETISKLAHHIWDNKITSIEKLEESTPYQNCCKKYSGWEQIILEASKDMIHGAQNYNDHNPILEKGKIGYKENDGISFKTRYGYKTLFKAISENKLGNISDHDLEEEYLSINLYSGEFSYAEIPKKFEYILGVTGTLRELNSVQKQIIKDYYQINRFSYIPNLFPRGKFQFAKNKNIFITEHSTYFNEIKSQINNNLAGTTDNGNVRAVLVVFEHLQNLNDFYNHDLFSDYKSDTQVLSPKDTEDEKDKKIRIASTRGQITLMTKDFARGCDFICNDQIVIRNGGIHVLQTYLSHDKSEEIQCMGRTARQDNPGSYSMVLLDESLEKYDITKNDIKKMHNDGEYYDIIDKKRISKYESLYLEKIKSVDIAKDQHIIAEQFIDQLIKGNTETIKKLLLDKNKGMSLQGTSKTIVLLDGTSSMGKLFAVAKKTVVDMFNIMHKTLIDNNYRKDSFLLKFVIYRNYNSSYETLLEFSNWTSLYPTLQHFLNKTSIEGGWGNEAIEVGLQYALDEHNKTQDGIDQIILIGDAPSNTDKQTERKRERRGEEYWIEHNFPKVYTSKLITEIVNKKIPVHTFYLDQKAEESFTSIANQTGGKSEMLQIHFNNGAKKLMESIAANVLFKAGGGGTNGEALREAGLQKIRKLNV